MQEIILKRLESNCYGPMTIEIYGGAYHLYDHGEPTLDDPTLIQAYVGVRIW